MQDDKLQRIKTAAAKIFSENGYAETRVAEIAAEAGVSPGTIYNFFRGKKELFDSINLPELETLRPELEKKRLYILKAALSLFGHAGYDGVTMDDIAKQAGLSRATLYQHFKNKEELFTAIIQESKTMAVFRDPLFRDYKGDLSYVVEKIGREFLGMFDEPDRLNLLRMIICESPRFPEIGQLLYREAISRGIVKVAAYLEKLKETGELREIDSMLAARILFGILQSFVVIDKLINPSGRDFTEEEIVSGVVDIFLNGVKKRYNLPH